jgi:hypothetical protein
MKKKNNGRRSEEMREEYDFARMRGGVRGKYVERLRQATNIIVLDRDVAAVFPTDDAVNAALRGILDTAKAVRSHGGLPNKALQPTPPSAVPSARKKRSPRRG